MAIIVTHGKLPVHEITKAEEGVPIRIVTRALDEFILLVGSARR